MQRDCDKTNVKMKQVQTKYPTHVICITNLESKYVMCYCWIGDSLTKSSSVILVGYIVSMHGMNYRVDVLLPTNETWVQDNVMVTLY